MVKKSEITGALSLVVLRHQLTNANTARWCSASHAAAAGDAAGGARRYGARAVGWDGPESPRLRVRLAAARVPHVRGRAARAGRRHAGRRRGAHAEVHRGGGRLLRARRVRVLPEGIARQVPKWQRRLVLLPWEGRHGVVGGARRRDGGRPRGPRQHLGAGAMRVVERLDGAPARPPRHPHPPACRATSTSHPCARASTGGDCSLPLHTGAAAVASAAALAARAATVATIATEPAGAAVGSATEPV